MTERKSSQGKGSKKQTEEEVSAAVVSEEEKAHQASLDEDINDIIDEIDDVLEENAEEMVRGFVQKGGQ